MLKSFISTIFIAAIIFGGIILIISLFSVLVDRFGQIVFTITFFSICFCALWFVVHSVGKSEKVIKNMLDMS